MNNIGAIQIKPMALRDIPIIDVDTHLTEPHDLWTSRAPARFKDRVPQVKLHNGTLHWVIDGDKPIGTTNPASAIRRDGSKAVGAEFMSWKIEEVHPGSYEAKARVAFMDEAGITAQVVYPNILGFGGQKTARFDPDLRLLVTQIYNDAMAEMQSDSNGRIMPMALLPWWDIKQAVAETHRCQQMGMRGINTNPDPHDHGLPDLSDEYWYPLWELCSDSNLPVNFHIGSSDTAVNWINEGLWPSLNMDQKLAVSSTALFFGSGRVLTNLIVSLVLERFPKLKVVSVESGVGWIPFVLESLQYQMREAGIKNALSPSEIFKRQIYACSWFEKQSFVTSTRLVGVDNVMFETDFPHPTCLYPDALGYISDAAKDFTVEERRKFFGGNAARVYNISESDIKAWST